MQTVPAQLGSGWGRVLEAIEIALLDARLAMFEEGLAALPLAIAAADAADAVAALLPQLLGLSALAATHPGHPHLCFSGLKCIQQLMQVLRGRGVGKQVCCSLKNACAAVGQFTPCDGSVDYSSPGPVAGGQQRVDAESRAGQRRRRRRGGCRVAHRALASLRRLLLCLCARGHGARGAHAVAL